MLDMHHQVIPVDSGVLVRINLFFQNLYPEYHLSILLGLAVVAVIIAIGFAIRAHELNKIKMKLQEQLQELDKTAKTLIRRDFELLQLSEQLRLMDEAKSHFVSVAAHQLRTPLSAIKWTLKLFLDGDLGAITSSQKEYIKSVYETNESMNKLVNDLLDVSRIESGRLKYDFKEVNVADVINKVVDLFSVEAQNKNIKLIFEETPNLLGMLKFDVEKIQMVLENLISNAISYTPAGGQVVVTLREEVDKIKISVADTGIGIASKDLPQLFNKFFRLDGAVKMVPNGTGLGLFISRSIVLRHGGTIDVQSEEGKGSVFSLTLPKKGPAENVSKVGPGL